jgi:hypothetical protein
MKRMILFFCFMIAATILNGQTKSPEEKLMPDAMAIAPDEKLIRDAETAIAIAKLILKPLYGQDIIKRSVFTATEQEQDGLWVVIGKPKARAGSVTVGGRVEVRMRSNDVRVTYILLDL